MNTQFPKRRRFWSATALALIIASYEMAMAQDILLNEAGDETVPPSTAVQRPLPAPTERPVATLPGQEPDTTVVTIQNGQPQPASPALPTGQQPVSQNERNQQLQAQPSQEQTQVGDFPIIGATELLKSLDELDRPLTAGRDHSLWRCAAKPVSDDP